MNKEYDFNGKKILIVDDVEMFRHIESYRLGLIGFEVDVAKNGKEALEKYLSKEPWFYQAIILDIIMPVMNGHECAKAIREAKREDSLCIPIISISVDNSLETIRVSREAGIDDVLDKPIDFFKLFEKLERLISNNILLRTRNATPKDIPSPTKRYTKLWKILIERNLTKSDLREMIDCSSTTIAKLSKGETVSRGTLERICIALDCELTDIVD